VLILAHSPHGLEEVHRLAYSTLIGATTLDVLVLTVLALTTAACCIFFSRRILLFSLDPEMAAAVGMRTMYWATGICAWLGVCIGLSIRTSGMLYAFGCLILPAMIAKFLCRESRTALVVAPAIAIGGATIGFMFANAYDYPPAQMTVALWCVAAVVASTTRWLAGLRT
jgi:ABC-type Mn2+/Zn2+ transport system permease subunit